ncbi:MAG: radical SAM protein [Proteobacteria bacterium]|nr:radical SAM protein [Pseudomonadota bacterium]
MGILQTLFRGRKRRRFAAWQIELTTLCPLRCTMCIKEEYRDWHRKDMDIDDFKKIVPYMKDVESVVLEGWGESLLHKDLIECIHLAKKEGTQVGFVTSGMGLTDEYTTKLTRAGVDFIGFSLSGATPETHNSIRVNSDFDTLINSIKLFKKLSDKYTPPNKPKMHIVYLMLKENIGELPILIDLAKEIDIEEIVLLNIIQISNPWQDDKKVFTCNDGESYRELIKKVLNKARQSNIKLTIPNLSPGEVSVCSENPLKNLYISVEGEVSPCVYLYPPVTSPFKRVFYGQEYDIDKVSFGNIFRESFESIWDKKGYVNFRDCFIQRQQKFKEVYQPFLEMKKPEKSDIPLTPLPCKTCYKMFGF